MREYYDIETLWLVGPDYDENVVGVNSELDELEQLMAVPRDRLADLEPLASSGSSSSST